MADHTRLNVGTGGDLIDTDDLGTRKVQGVKVMIGGDGVDGGYVHSGNPLPVTGTVALSGTVDTELPAAAALADNTANPTVPGVGAFLMGWDSVGANWDRFPLYTEDAAAPANPVGPQIMARVIAGPLGGAAVSTDGDSVAISTDLQGAMWVRDEFLVTEDDPAPANPTGHCLMARVLDTVPTGLGTVSADGDMSALTASRQGALFVNIITGTEKVGGDAAQGLDVDVTRVGGGSVAHDGVGTSVNPLLMGGYASAAAPADVSTDGDAVRDWHLRNGAQVAALVSGSTLIGVGNGTAATALRVTLASDGTGLVDTELPAAAALADATSNPTTPLVGVALEGFNGTTWDRLRSDTTQGLDVDVTRAQGFAAQDAAISGNPQQVGYRASTATPSAMSADGDVVYPWADRSGATVVTGYAAQDAAIGGNPVQVGFRASTVTPTAMSADGDVVFPWADRNGAVVTTPFAATGTHTNVTGSASSVTLLAANTNRRGATIFNDSSATLFVRFSATASSSNFDVKLLQDGYLEVPFGYRGIIDGIWSSATGNARVNEFT